jgi:hypothetical protein
MFWYKSLILSTLPFVMKSVMQFSEILLKENGTVRWCLLKNVIVVCKTFRYAF